MKKFLVAKEICVFEPYAVDHTIYIYRKLSKFLKVKVTLLTFSNLSTSTSRIKIIRLSKDRLLPHLVRKSDIEWILNNFDAIIWNFEIESPSSYRLFKIAKAHNYNGKIVAFSYENQTLSDVVKSFFKNNLFSRTFLIKSILRRIFRFIVYEWLLAPKKYIDKNVHCFGYSPIATKLLRRKGYSCETIYYPVALFRKNTCNSLQKNFFYLGRLVQEKGIEEIVNLFEQLGDSNLSLFLIGSGSFFRNKSNSNNVKFLGVKTFDELKLIFNDIDVLLVPSIEIPNWCEQYARVIAEGLCANIPVIARKNATLDSIYGERITYLDTFSRNNFLSVLPIINNRNIQKDSISIYHKLFFNRMNEIFNNSLRETM